MSSEPVSTRYHSYGGARAQLQARRTNYLCSFLKKGEDIGTFDRSLDHYVSHRILLQRNMIWSFGTGVFSQQQTFITILEWASSNGLDSIQSHVVSALVSEETKRQHMFIHICLHAHSPAVPPSNFLGEKGRMQKPGWL